MTTPPPRGRPPLPREEKAEGAIHLRAQGWRKGGYNAAARAQGISLAAWMFAVCDAAAEKQGVDLGALKRQTAKEEE